MERIQGYTTFPSSNPIYLRNGNVFIQVHILNSV
jgi:hypothetical protein